MNFKEKIINAIYGQAVCDAVGNPFEFKYDINPEDVVKYANNTKTLVVSDDSQMMLFGFDAIQNLDKHDGTFYEKIKESFTMSYLDWYYTQTHDENETLTSHGLVGFKSMYSIESPGNTCLSALNSLMHYEPVDNDSMGCGSVMRLLPLVYLFDEKFGLTYDEVIMCAKISGYITHKHIANDTAIEKYMNAARKIIRGVEVRCPEAGHISELGEGWIAPECVDMGIWAYSTAKSFDDLLALSNAHDGDSDSVAAVAGSLWGLSGKEVPQQYIDKLDALDAIGYIISKI